MLAGKRRFVPPPTSTLLLLALVASILHTDSPARAVTLVVTRFDDPAPDACSPGDCSLREAVTAANASPEADAIDLPAGTYTLSIPGVESDNAGGDLDVKRDLTITGAGAMSTTIDAAGAVTGDRVLQVEADGSETASVTITGVTMQGGMPPSSSGGGIRVATGETLNLEDVVVADNTAQAGGGLYIAGSATLNRVTVSGNRAIGMDGGGIRSSPGGVVLTNVTLSGNSAAGDGGGLQIQDAPSSASLNNTTITGNTADSDGDGTGNGGGLFRASGTAILRNTIVAGNSDASAGAETPDCGQGAGDAFASSGHNLIGNTTGCTFTPGTGDLQNVDPMLGALADNGGFTLTHALLPGSPAIDAAGADAAPTDQRGVPRNPDIGSYELAFCKKVVINRVGTPGNDVITGTSGADGFLAQDGNDTAKGLGGSDAACMGAGKDTATGGGGKDTLLGEAGKDKLKGQGGKDVMKGGSGKDTCTGGGGKDKATCEKEKKVP